MRQILFVLFLKDNNAQIDRKEKNPLVLVTLKWLRSLIFGEAYGFFKSFPSYKELLKALE